jgi:hypothetical protein
MNDQPYRTFTAKEFVAEKDKQEEGAPPLFDPWADYIVPDFPLDILPPVAQDFVTTQSILIGCCPSALAMAVLAAFSGALDHRFALKMMRNGRWQESPRLWLLLAGDPSRKKTPVINAATRPLEQHEDYFRGKYEAEVRSLQGLIYRGEFRGGKPNG